MFAISFLDPATDPGVTTTSKRINADPDSNCCVSANICLPDIFGADLDHWILIPQLWI